ncbi:MAG TPA: TonB family protein [Candidatus Bacteroides pullicola]|uniref:TonB family protein n=1 Tax=Candidatus Bacteroides pullicola TaxID=2838475 RepID=A0A9D1ZIK9_9BACE|nr:TonB family protein [Candidatus Bacteroides pullicola]
MGTFLVYILKSALCLAAFYLFYRLLLSRDTFHRFNRVALLCVLVLSAVVPLIEVSTTETSSVGQTMLTLEEWLALAEAMAEAVPAEPVEPSRAVWPLVLMAVYGVGVLFFLVRNVCSLFRLGQLLRGTTREDIRRYVKDAPRVLLLVHGRDIAPFSWMRCIVIARKDLEEDGRPILVHELAHIRLGHSWDLLLTDLCCFVQWFNPAAWLLKQELQAVHEYEADEAVLCAGVNAREYQLLLIKKAVGTRLYSMANSLNHSKLKKRITMMQRRKSSPWARAKLLYVLPLAAVAVAAFARPEVSGVSNELSSAKVTDLAEIVKAKSVKSAVVPQDTARKVYQSYKVHDGASAETHAGMQALMSYFDKHVSQSAATEKDVSRVMRIRVIFNNEGELAEAKVLKSADPATDAEAVRVMKNIPRSISEKLKGDTIAMAFTVPVKFSVAPLKEGMRESGSVVTIREKSSLAPQDMAKSSRSQRGATNVPRLEDYRVPEFPGGREAQMRFLAENMRYPQEAREKGIEGKVIVKFSVDDETGEILNPRVIRSVHPALDAEALRLVKAMPRWTWVGDPGKKKLKSVEIEQPIEFKLDGKNTSEVYDMVAEAPQFPGGSKAMMQFIEDNLNYPQEAKDKKIEGRVILQLVVDETGQVTDPKVMRGIDPLLDAEAIRVVKAMPRWTPGKQDGKAVSVRYTLPVAFLLGGKKAPGTPVTATATPADKVLWVLDGKEMPFEEFFKVSGSDIESVRFLKGQQAIDKYGERGRNGVLEATSKAVKTGEKADTLYLSIGTEDVTTLDQLGTLSPDKVVHIMTRRDQLGAKSKDGEVAIGVSPVESPLGKWVTGSVADSQGKPIAGAVVRIVDSERKTIQTDADGNFFFCAPEGSELEVSSEGYQTARVEAQPKLMVRLKAE